MAIWYYAQIEWLGEPTREQVKEANRRLREIDYDAPKLDAMGYYGSWREPVGDLSKSEQVARVLDAVFPCRVRIAAPDYGTCELREKTAKDVCEASAWVYSRPLFEEGVATRAGAMCLMHDDGTMGEPVQVREGDRLSDIIVKDRIRNIETEGRIPDGQFPKTDGEASPACDGARPRARPARS